jgi:hypothetical protein
VRIVRACAAATFLALAVGVLAACGETTAAPTTTEERRKLLPPLGLEAEPSAFEATLRWTYDPKSLPVERVQIYRDGEEIADLAGDSTEFIDRNVLPGHRYRYGVEAEGGGAVSEGATVILRTTKLKRADARVDGLYDVQSRVTATSGWIGEKVGERHSYGWRLDAKCSGGACRVEWGDPEFPLSTVLRRRGGTYSGSVTGFFGSRCHGGKYTTTKRFDLRVSQAKPVYRVWRAFKLKGTVRTTGAAQLGCVATMRTEAVTLTFAG